MIEFAILATGPSMTQEIANAVGRCIVVNDAFRLRPDADGLCANDLGWWKKHPDALAFKGRKFCSNPPPKSTVEKVKTSTFIQSGSNSSLLALHIAITVFQAKRVLLYGLDMNAAKGAHFFGPHVGLMNTNPSRFEVFKKQFANYAKMMPKDVAVYNATTDSALKCFPFLN